MPSSVRLAPGWRHPACAAGEAARISILGPSWTETSWPPKGDLGGVQGIGARGECPGRLHAGAGNYVKERRRRCQETPENVRKNPTRAAGSSVPCGVTRLRWHAGAQGVVGPMMPAAWHCAMHHAPNRDRGGELWLPPAVGGG